MHRELSDKEMETKSRPSVIALCVLTLRLMENWRAVVSQATGRATDTDCTMIVMAVVAIGAEKFTRTHLDSALHNLETAMPQGHLNKSNLSSIASATGINRETVRRKVSGLEKVGILENNEVDGIRVTPSFASRDEVRGIVQAQVDAIARATTQLRSFGVLGTKRRSADASEKLTLP